MHIKGYYEDKQAAGTSDQPLDPPHQLLPLLLADLLSTELPRFLGHPLPLLALILHLLLPEGNHTSRSDELLLVLVAQCLHASERSLPDASEVEEDGFESG